MTHSQDATVTCRGVQIPLDSHIITPKVARQLSREFYETPEVTALPLFCTQADRVLELGSGIGFISTYLAKTVNVSHVTCVEANPVLCDFIARVHKLNEVPDAQVQNAVLMSDVAEMPESGEMPFYTTSPFWSSSLTRPAKGFYCPIVVPTIRLSDMIAKVDPNVIVCDIEGGELDLFEQADLGRVRNVFMELHTRVYGGPGVVKVFENMHRLGFFYHQRISARGTVLFRRF